MSEDGLSASASSAESAAGASARPDRGAATDKPPRRAKRQNGQQANGHGSAEAVKETKALWAQEKFRGLELMPMGVRGLYLDLAACRRARRWFRNPAGDLPNVGFIYKYEKAKDGRMAPVRADIFAGGCPIVVSLLREPGDRPDINVDEYKIGWAGARWDFQPQRVSHKQLVSDVGWLARLNAGVILKSEHSLVCKIIAAQISDKNHKDDSPIIRLPSSGLVCEGGLWFYGYAYGDRRPGDRRNPSRRLHAELDGDRMVVRNAIGGEPVPVRPIPGSRLALLADYLTAWGHNAGALATFCFAARTLCASVAPLQVSLFVVGESENGKTVTVRFATQCISPMGAPEFRLAGGGGTANSIENVFRAHRDCLAQFDDKLRNEKEATQICIRLASVVHEGGVSRQRLNPRDPSAAEGVHVECGVGITADNLKGLEKCRQRRMLPLIFDKKVNAGDLPDLAQRLLGEQLVGEDFNDIFEAGLPSGREAMSGVIRYILKELQAATGRAIDAGMTPDAAEQLAREQFAGAIEMRRRQIIGQLFVELRRGRPGAQFLQSVAEAVAELWNGAVLLDQAAEFTGSLSFDTPVDALGPVTSRLRRHILSLAFRAADLINGRISIDANVVAERFPRDLRRVLTSGRWGLLNHDSALPQIKGVPLESAGWTRDPDAGKRKDSRRPPRPGFETEDTWRPPARVLGYCKGNEIWMEPSLFSVAMADIRDSEIDYEQRDAVLRQLLEDGILIRGEAGHLLPKRRFGGKLGKRFIVLRADRIWPSETKEKARQDASGSDAQIIRMPVFESTPVADSMPAEHHDSAPEEPVSEPVDDKPGAASAPASVPAAAAQPASGKRAVFLEESGFCLIDAQSNVTSQDHQPETRPCPTLQAPLAWAGHQQVDQIFLMPSWTKAAGLPQHWPTGATHEGAPETSPYLPYNGAPHPFARLPDDFPWRLSHPDELNVWTYAHHKERERRRGFATIDIVFPGYDDTPLADAPNASVLAHALAAFRLATGTEGRNGFTWRGRPGQMGIRIWQQPSEDKGVIDTTPLFPPCDFPDVARQISPEPARDISWVRRPEGAELTAPQGLAMDRKVAYLGVAGGVRCGYGELQQVRQPVFKKETAGWWEIRYRAPPSWPATLPAPGWPLASGERGWLMTETVAFLQEIDAEIEFFQAWTWARATRALERWQARLSRARTFLLARCSDVTLSDDARAGARLAEKLVKVVCHHGIGWLNRADDRDRTEITWRYRPHIRSAVLAQCAANVLRDVGRAAGVLPFHDGTLCMHPLLPVHIQVDEALYLTEENDPAALARRLGLKFGQALGSYSCKSGCRAADPLRQALAAVQEHTSPAGWHGMRARANGAIGRLRRLLPEV